jgi:uncharacterized protein YebE (UPF0316 family)
MNWDVAAVGSLIFLARIGDVTLGTIRTICIVQGRALTAWFLGFFEILIWLFAAAQVFTNLDSPIYAIIYALGFATGNYVGIKVEQWLAFGHQIVRIFTRSNGLMMDGLRTDGFRVTTFPGEGRSGPVNLLFIETRRKDVSRVIRRAGELDPECFYLVDDIRHSARPAALPTPPTGWRAVFKKK